MIWRFEHSGKEVEIDDSYGRFSSGINMNNKMSIPLKIVKHLGDKSNIPRIHNNCEIVVDIVGIRLLNEWYKVVKKKETIKED